MCLGKIVVCLTMVAALAISAAAQVSAPPAPAGSSRLDDAKTLISKGKCAEAIPLLESLVSSDKASAPQAIVLMGDCYKALQNWSKAIERFEKLLSDHPNVVAPDKEVKLWVMDCYLANGNLGKYQSLRKELANDYQSDAWKLYYVAGRRYFWSHEYAKAVPELEQAVKLGTGSKDAPDFIDANRRLLQCYIVQEQWDKAEELAQELVKDYPDLAYEWRYEIGKCYQGREEYAKATESLEAAARLTPKKAGIATDMYKAMLDCYDETGRLDKAIPLAEKLAGDYPGESAWQWRLGWYYLTKQQYDKAAPLFEQVIASSKAAWEIRKALIFRGQCLYALGKGPDALEMVETYFKDKPAQWDDHLLVKAGVLFYGPRDDQDCISALTELLAQVDAGKQSILVLTARELMYKALNRSGDLAEAALVAEKMGATAKDPTWLAKAGEAYYKAGNYAEAKRVYKNIADDRNVPDGIQAQCMQGLALCYWRTGLKDSARRLALRVRTEYSGTLAATAAMNSLNEWAASK